MEAIALHVASTFGGAQFYISCGQVEVTNGGSGSPGPLVAIPGVYTGYVCFLCNYPCLECIVTLPPRLQEPGILINIYDPVPTNYTQPGPVSYIRFDISFVSN